MLNEKNIPCTLCEIDVSNGEQCSQWFMQMNPKMDVPVLQNETLIVPSSSQIISYLEANFIGKHPTLLPTEDRNLLKQIAFLHRKISQIPIGVISLGTFLHPNIVSSPQLPFIGPLRASFLRSYFLQFYFIIFEKKLFKINDFFEKFNSFRVRRRDA